ncbi:sialin-like [Liolophura sinensis]|uniref:sialin-like n=1 Tax=Liolophura sinensis TaxID=3198878 RepID=UPI00315832E0
MEVNSKETEAMTGSEQEKIDPKDVPWWTSSRLGLAVIGFFGFINVYALRVNMSVAIVCMVNGTALELLNPDNKTNVTDEIDSGCLSRKSGTAGNLKDGEFLWNKTTQGLVLGSFFWGYLVTQIPGGWVATRIGGKRVFGWTMFAAAILTLLTPIAAQTSYIFLIVIRILLGLATGVAFPAMHAIWGHWSPVMERSKLTSFTYAGAQIGNVITFPLAGMLCQYGFAGGWPSIFYVLGAGTIVWFIAWMLLVTDYPQDHKRISDIERRYILQGLKDSVQTHKKHKVPWVRMFTSLPVWAIVVSNTCSDWGNYTLLTGIPTYMNEVLKFDITSNGLYSALPYIGFWLGINVSGYLADLVRTRGILSTTWTRKLWDAFGKVIPAIMLIALGYLECTQSATAVGLLVLAVALTAPIFSGYTVNHVDIAPAYAGVLFGISNSVAALTGFVSPVVTGILTPDQTREQWLSVFYISAAIYIVGAIFYLLFASGELQEWARDKDSPEVEEMIDKDGVELVDMKRQVVA